MKIKIPLFRIRCLAFLVTLLTSGLLWAKPIPVWIDTDPACGLAATDDVDDCWAMLLAFKSGSFNISGVSTVFGNVSEKQAYKVAVDITGRCARTAGSPPPSVSRGAGNRLDKGNDPTAAVSARRRRSKKSRSLF